MKIQEIVANVALESAKVGYNPATDTNWCHLPMELRSECIKLLNFKDKSRLRGTSHTEKQLVDWKKHKFDAIAISYNNKNPPLKYLITVKNSSESIQITNRQHHFTIVSQFLEQCMKRAEFHDFALTTILTSNGNIGWTRTPMWRSLKKFLPIPPVKRISLNTNCPMYLNFLKNCLGAEEIDMNYIKHCPEVIGEFAAIPVVQNSKIIRMGMIDMLSAFLELSAKLMETGADANKTIQFAWDDKHRSIDDCIDDFDSEFRRVKRFKKIYTTPTEMRISTPDPTKHTLIKAFRVNDSIELASCIIIPARIQRFQYPEQPNWVCNFNYNAEKYNREHRDNYNADITCFALTDLGLMELFEFTEVFEI